EQREDGYECGDFPETTAFQRYGVKTSEKAYASDPWRTRVCGCIPFAGASDASDPWRTRVCCRNYRLPEHAHLRYATWLTLDEQAVLEFLSSVSVDLCSRWTTN
ncbi:hypothetical protein GBAR_LOCUS31071, partial [Geodia barretti]